jgi:hypothetical protein
MSEADELHAEIERLRAALEQIEDMSSVCRLSDAKVVARRVLGRSNGA